MSYKNLALALSMALSLGTTQCSHAEGSADEHAPARPTATPPSAPAGSPNAAAPSDAPSAMRVPIDGLPVLGAASALVTVVAFSDYECPYCGKAESTVARLRSEYGDDLRVVIAPRPLPMHEHATAAARAVLAAAEQGKAEAMNARLFANQSALDDASLTASAQAIGLDVAAFEAARTGPSTAAALERSLALATSLGANGTPTFFVNGRRLMGARPYDEFRTLIEEERAKAKTMVAGGVLREQIYTTLMAAASPAAAPKEAAVDDAVVEVVTDDAPARGSNHAPVTIALFSDFECPYCVRAEATLRSLETAYAGKVKVVFRHRPLPMHEHARLAAKASLAAEAQGRFWEYHDTLVAHRDALDRASLEGYAKTLGLDLARFDRDIEDPRFEARITSDEAQATKLHVEGTPTAFVNGRRIVGAQPLAVFQAAVDRALTTRDRAL